jgi:hypothetical protein
MKRTQASTVNAGIPGQTDQDMVEFSVTRYELFVLLKHWQKLWWDQYFAGFCRDESVSEDVRGQIMNTLSDRSERIGKVIGHPDVVTAAKEEAAAEFTKWMDPRLVDRLWDYMRDA